MKESGYFDIHDQVSEQDVCEALVLHSDYIDDWLQFSEDKSAVQDGILCGIRKQVIWLAV